MIAVAVSSFCVGWLFANVMMDEDVPWTYGVPICLAFGANMAGALIYLFGSA